MTNYYQNALNQLDEYLTILQHAETEYHTQINEMPDIKTPIYKDLSIKLNEVEVSIESLKKDRDEIKKKQGKRSIIECFSDFIFRI